MAVLSALLCAHVTIPTDCGYDHNHAALLAQFGGLVVVFEEGDDGASTAGSQTVGWVAD
jgi:hypothetical protein